MTPGFPSLQKTLRFHGGDDNVSSVNRRMHEGPPGVGLDQMIGISFCLGQTFGNSSIVVLGAVSISWQREADDVVVRTIKISRIEAVWIEMWEIAVH